MRILFLSNEFFNIYNFRLSLLKRIEKEFTDPEILIVAKYDGYEKKININNNQNFNLDIDSRSMSLINNVKALFQLNKIIRNGDLDILISYTFKCNFFACLLNIFYGKKLIINITGLGEMFLSNNPLKKIFFYFYCILLQKSDRIICQNIYDKNLLLSKNIKLKKKLFLIPGSGINLDYFKFNKVDLSKKFNFLMVARIIKEKGIIEFIEAAQLFMSKFPNKANFTIIGKNYNDNFKSTFIDKIKDTNINYINSSNNIYAEIINSTCCVLPSYREGLSRFLLESLAVGRPIITSNVPGCNDLVINNSNGYLLQDINSNELFSLFEKFSSLPHKKIIDFSSFSREYSLKYDEKTINREILSILKSLL